MTPSIKNIEVIRIENDDEFEILVDPECFTIRLRDDQPGSMRRDGDYGYTIS